MKKVLMDIKDKAEKYIEINSGFRKLYIQFDYEDKRRKKEGNQNNQNRWRPGAEKDQQTGKGNYTKDRNTGRRYAGYHV